MMPLVSQISHATHPLDLFKRVHYVVHTSVGKRVVGLRLKGLLVSCSVTVCDVTECVNNSRPPPPSLPVISSNTHVHSLDSKLVFVRNLSSDQVREFKNAIRGGSRISQRGMPTPKEFSQNFPENCMKMKKIGPKLGWERVQKFYYVNPPLAIAGKVTVSRN